MMQLQSTFKIYKGYCHILLDRIVISTSADPSVPVEETINRTPRTILYSLLMVVLLGATILAFAQNEHYTMGICGVFAILFGIQAFANARNSVDNIIAKANILEVSFYKSIYGVQQAHFVITYRQEGSTKKRVIFLTNRYAGEEDDEISTALAIMDAEFG